MTEASTAESATWPGGRPPTVAVEVLGPGQHRLIEHAPPEPGPGEALVEVAAAGICGSDVELFEGRRPAEIVRYPVIPGHEWAGSVLAVGPDVRHVRPGDPVIAEGFRSCGVCARCRAAEPTLCTAEYAETGFTHPGAFSHRVLVPARLVHRLPDPLPPGTELEHCALLEPAACVAAGLLAAPPLAGGHFAVLGTGTLSLLAVQMLAAHRPASLTVVGRRAHQFPLAERFGATRCLLGEEVSSAAGTADLVFEATGAASVVPTAFDLARRGGTVVLEGIAGTGEIAMDPDVFALKQLTVLGVFGASPAAWAHTIGLLAAGVLDLAPLVSHRVPLSGYERALDLLQRRPPGLGKILLVPDATA
ncbi:dehydrogenase [Actinoalloteichus sp. AHMU CJ021]|uniref:Threonine dehydrogenase n=1 Tax=Actinoalloteichus caeruleus DSM 43889 TaxID=1120930 RepID=A0ABT1JI03_ACTCY|nr:alcohol dehydrogenase catalytic domain-containing protein [Actinoalloteichus caeruleus]AUS77873.1 dehydrogenase [Actinoalloteichus sp. AHMU CJ021]MCP2331829.1 Threonine dehydrogenase [Actinoalloteichus caeruleus DSM 43889]